MIVVDIILIELDIILDIILIELDISAIEKYVIIIIIIITNLDSIRLKN